MIKEKFCPPNTPVAFRQQLVAIKVNHIDFNNQLKHGEIVVNKLAAKDLTNFFNRAFELKFPIEKVIPANEYGFDDEAMMADNDSSSFNYRSIAGSDQISPHAFGVAFDINPVLNPYIRYPKAGDTIVSPPGATIDIKKAGTFYATHPLVIYMELLGWEWGGKWPQESGRTDYQHFQNLNLKVKL